MKKLLIFLRGLLMGFCDIIPGVSGGTIAFITGIYDRLISAIANLAFFPKSLFQYLTGKMSARSFARVRKSLDAPFLITLFLGIILAVILGSWGMTFLLKNYFVYTISFFIGLILVSSLFIAKEIKIYAHSSMIAGLIALLLGVSLAFILPATIVPSWWFVILAGFLAISAMFLPGISGSFILLILGVYEFMIKSIHTLNIPIIILFLIGALIGAVVISRIISYLLKKYKSPTFSVLLGLVIGCLAVPLKRLIDVWSGQSIFLALVFFLLGVLLVWLINKFS